MDDKMQALRRRLGEVDDLTRAGAVLHWDQATYMPAGGAAGRARQSETLERLAHEKFTDRVLGNLLDDLEREGCDAQGLVRATRRDFDRAVLVPAALVGEMAGHALASYSAWVEARPANDFAAMRPYLEKTLDLSRRYSECFSGYEHIADPLIDVSDYGMTTATVRGLFAELREQLAPLVEAIGEKSEVDDACLRQRFAEEEQLAFGTEVIKRFGYDFNRGRQDKTAHPFQTTLGPGDARITTRVNEHFLNEALFSTLHESGHAMYEQGIALEFAGTPLAKGTSSAVHESQSRLWENLVGRSRGFWQYYYPRLQQVFPEQLGRVEVGTFYRAINKAEPSLIRTDADEATYNLHVMIRFEVEVEMLEGRLAVRDLPDAWRARYQANLGVTAPDDKDGVLQDVHWFGGPIGGAFQGYTLGNILSAQFFDAALQAHPDIDEHIETGRFDLLHGWLQENIYQHGSRYTTNELVERVTGGPINVAPLVKYLRAKYGQIYSL